MNRRGNIAFLLLPVIALVFSLLALFAFLSFSNNFDNRSRDFSDLMGQGDFAERYVIKKTEMIVKDSINCDEKIYKEICKEQDLKKRIVAISAKNDINYNTIGNIFAKFRNSEFEWIENDGGYEIKISGLFIQSLTGQLTDKNGKPKDKNMNKLLRDFDLEIGFDGSGKAVSEEIRYK